MKLTISYKSEWQKDAESAQYHFLHILDVQTILFQFFISLKYGQVFWRFYMVILLDSTLEFLDSVYISLVLDDSSLSVWKCPLSCAIDNFLASYDGEMSFLLVALTRLIIREPEHWITWSHRTGVNFPFSREKRIQCFSVST